MPCKICIALLLVCGAALAESPPSGVISGTITDGVTRLPIDGAGILLRIRGVPVEVTSDKNGSYSIANVPAGSALLSVEKDGYSEIDLGSGNRDVSFQIGVGQKIHRDFSLTHPARITGTVVDAETESAVDIAVIALREDYSNGVRRYIEAGQSTSGHDPGTFEISGLSTGQYLLEALPKSREVFSASAVPGKDKSEYDYGPAYYQNARIQEAAIPIILLPGESRKVRFAVHLYDHRRLTGTVTSTLKKLSGPITVVLEQEQMGDYRWIAQGSLKAPGEFQIDHLSEGDYRLCMWAGGSPNSPATYAESLISISDKDLTGIRLTLEPGVTIKGTVNVPDKMTTAAANMHVGLLPIGRMQIGPNLYAEVETDGSFAIPNVLAGEYSVYITGEPEGLKLTGVKYGGYSSLNSVLVIDQRYIDSRLDLALSSHLGTVRGTVLDGSKPEYEGAKVVLLPDPIPSRFDIRSTLITMLTGNGTFLFESIPLGSYKAFMLTGSETLSEHDLGLLNRKAATADVLEVSDKGVNNITLSR